MFDKLAVDLEPGIELTRLEFEPGWELVLPSCSPEEAWPPVCRSFVETPSSGCWYVPVVSLGSHRAVYLKCGQGVLPAWVCRYQNGHEMVAGAWNSGEW